MLVIDGPDTDSVTWEKVDPGPLTGGKILTAKNRPSQGGQAGQLPVPAAPPPRTEHVHAA